MQSKLPLVIAIVFGLVAFLGIRQYLQSQQQKTATQAVLVFARDMSRGETIGRNDLSVARIPVDAARSIRGFYGTSAADRARVVDGILSGDVGQGEPVVRGLITSETVEDAAARFSELLEPGERAISLTIDNAGSVTGLIRPGDNVDILANLHVPEITEREINPVNVGPMTVSDVRYEATTVYLLENVKVLAVGTTYIGEERTGGGMGGSTVTIAVGPRAAQILSFSMRNGQSPTGGGVTFTLILRSERDTTVEQVRDVVTYDDVLAETELRDIQDEIDRLNDIRKERERMPASSGN